jgi:hypothetical protein
MNDFGMRALRRTLVTVGVTGALAVGGAAFPAAASAAEPASRHTVAMGTPHLFVAGWCPFGKHKGRKGCRGGSIGDALNENGYSIATNVGCGLVGLGAGAATANPAVGFGVGAGCGVLLDAEPAH